MSKNNNDNKKKDDWESNPKVTMSILKSNSQNKSEKDE